MRVRFRLLCETRLVCLFILALPLLYYPVACLPQCLCAGNCRRVQLVSRLAVAYFPVPIGKTALAWAAVPPTTVKLKDCASIRVKTINWCSKNMSFPTMSTHRVMNVDFQPLGMFSLTTRSLSSRCSLCHKRSSRILREEGLTSLLGR